MTRYAIDAHAAAHRHRAGAGGAEPPAGGAQQHPLRRADALQADALVTVDEALARKAEGIGTVQPLEALTRED
jgi:hypothetical protein